MLGYPTGWRWDQSGIFLRNSATSSFRSYRCLLHAAAISHCCQSQIGICTHLAMMWQVAEKGKVCPLL